jgi:cytochrome c oxidase assembly protein Cox11
MNNDSLLKYLLNLFITLITLGFILVPSFALISSSQSNDTLSEATLSNETSFSSLSRELAENQGVR